MARRNDTPRKHWTESEGRAAITAWRESGLGLLAYSRFSGITPNRLVYWRDRLGGTTAGTKVEFLPVEFGTTAVGRSGSDRVEIAFDGVVIGIGLGVGVDVVATLAVAVARARGASGC
jgi:hypothetical protein